MAEYKDDLTALFLAAVEKGLNARESFIAVLTTDALRGIVSAGGLAIANADELGKAYSALASEIHKRMTAYPLTKAESSTVPG